MREIISTSFADVVRAAIPNADHDCVEYVLWNRTAFPMGRVTAQGLFKKASGFRRASDAGKSLCDFCDRLSLTGQYCCQRCTDALKFTETTEN